MNTARLTHRLAEAENDPAARAEAIGDGVDERYVTRDRSAERTALIPTEIGVLRTERASMSADLQRTPTVTRMAGFAAILAAVLSKG